MKKDNFYKTQIEGLSDVEETVRVIERSAASHIHFLKKKVRALSEYKQHIQASIGRLSRFYWDDNHPLLQERVHGDRALLVITGGKGIVGGLYHALINEVITKSRDYEHIWVIGNKGKEYLDEEDIQVEQILASFDFDDLPRGEEIHKMAEHLFEQFQTPTLKKIDVLYANFISLTQQSPTIAKFLPFNFVQDKSFDFASAAVETETDKSTEAGRSADAQTMAGKHDKIADGFPIFGPSKKLIFDELLKKYIDVSFAEIILEAKLSEFAARTVTAESAVKETERLVNAFNHELLKMKHLTTTQKQIESFSVHQLIRI